MIKKETKKCVICEKQYKGYGNNAEPIKHGQCCDKCNKEKVIPRRIDLYLTGRKGRR